MKKSTMLNIFIFKWFKQQACFARISGVIVLLLCFQYSKSQTVLDVSGDITTNTTWSADTIRVNSNIQVNGATLTIAPGTWVVFKGSYQLEIVGTLIAQGGVGDSIVFTASNQITGWRGIRFDSTLATSDSSFISYCVLQYSRANEATAPNNVGGALYTKNFSKIVIEHSRLSYNSTFGYGGAIYCETASPIIRYNKIVNNTSSSHAGAIALRLTSNPYILGNEIAYNKAGTTSYGGGLYIDNSSPKIISNKICNNTSRYGAGLYLNISNAKIINNLIANNSATGTTPRGGGVYMSASNPDFFNNTVVNNLSYDGGGFGLTSSSNPLIKNSIIWGNVATNFGSQFRLLMENCDPTIIYSCIQGGTAGFSSAVGSYTGTNTNNIETDPIHTSASSGAGNTIDGLLADWSITSSSPCKNAGTPDTTGMGLPTTDILNNTRITQSIIDIGAYERVVNNNFLISIIDSLNISCYGDNTGWAKVRASGNTGPYTYAWSSGATDSVAINLSANIWYTVTVTDQSFNTKTDKVMLTQPAQVIANAGVDQSICIGATANITATGGPSYLWSTGETTASIAKLPIVNTTYTVTATSNGCTHSDDMIVTVNAYPTANAGLDQAICTGTTANITASGGATYLWSSGETTSIINKAPLVTITYTVTATSNGCTHSDDMIVTVNAYPTVNAGTDQSICTGTIANITASGGTTYLWSSEETTSIINKTPLATITYTVTATSNGCTHSDDMIVTVNAYPIANAGTDQSICTGTTANITAIGGNTYLWSSGETVSIINKTPLATITYTVTATSNGCTHSDEIVVTVNAYPTVNAGTDQSICTGTTANITAIGGDTYLWSGGQTTDIINVIPLATTTYTVTAISNGCTHSDNLVVAVKALPIANSGIDQSICIGTIANITASGGATYLWSSGETTSIINKAPLVTITYTVTATSNGCTHTDDMIVTVKALPTANAGIDQSICIGTIANITASGGTTYLWSSEETTSIINKTPLATITYTVTATSNGCTHSDDMIVTVNEYPTANAGVSQSICTGTTANITASGGTTYLWSTGETTSIINKTPLATTTYTVTATSNGCTHTDNVLITVKPLPTPNAGKDKVICMGDSLVLTATGGGSYEWNTAETKANINVKPVLNYSYIVTVTVNGCTASDDIAITVNPLPTANAGKDVDICRGNSTALSASGGTLYIWSSAQTASTITVAPSTTQPYYLTVTNDFGCTGTDVVVVKVNLLPTVTAGKDYAICFGNSVSLTAKSNNKFKWSTDDSSSVITVFPINTTIYSATATTPAGCSAKDEAIVTVNALPLVSAGNDKNVCKGVLATLQASGAASYRWNTGSLSSVINVTPLVSTIYTVTGTNIAGCSASVLAVVEVKPLPTADAGFNDSICIGQSASLTATGGDTYSWNMGASSAVINVSTFQNTIYTVTVSLNGCTATDEAAVIISQPQASAGVDKSFCSGTSLQLTASGGISYIWNTGDLTKTINVAPLLKTIYTVTTTNSIGCTASDQAIVTVYTVPSASAGQDILICNGIQTVLTASGTGSYLWSSGSHAKEPVVNPIITTTYTLTVTNSGACTATDDVVVTVAGGHALYTNTIDNALKTLMLTDASTGAISSRFWNFGDGGTSSLTNPNHIYTSAGNYQVQLQVKDNVSGCIDDYTEIISIGGVSCKADFDVVVNNSNYAIACTDKSQLTGAIYAWDFGDGHMSSDQNPSNRYTDAGNYTIALTVSTAENTCMDKATKTISIGQKKCKVDFIYFVDSLANQVTFNSSVSGLSTNLYWSFGDGSSSNKSSVVHQYSTVGYYNVTLSTFDSISQCMDDASKQVLVSKKGTDCQVSFVYQSINGGSQVNFSNTTPVSGYAAFTWDFGDGTIPAIDAAPKHPYTNTGYYNVCLTIRDQLQSCVSMLCQDVNVSNGNELCRADYSLMIDSITKRVAFTDKSIGSPDSWLWNFGDGFTASERNPIHNYKTAGQYLVNLSIGNSITNCSDVYSVLINVGAIPTKLSCSFGYEFDSSYRNKGDYAVKFIGSVLGNMDELIWSFGDGYTNNSSLEPTHSFNELTSYNVCLKVWNNQTSDTASACKPIYVSKTDIKSVKENPYFDIFCLPNPIISTALISYSIPSNSTVKLVVLDMFGREVAVLDNTFKQAGTYSINKNLMGLSAGIYYLKLRSNKEEIVKRIIKIN